MARFFPGVSTISLLAVLASALAGAEEPGPADARRRAEESLAAGRFAEALEVIDRALDRLAEPSADGQSRGARLDLRLLRARALFGRGDYGGSEEVLREVIPELTGVDRRADALARLARALALGGKDEAALGAIDRAIELRNVPEHHRVAASLALRARRHDRLARHAGAILESDPGDPFARFLRGISLSRSGRFEEALPDLRRGLEVPGAERDARFELALALGKSGRPREALSELWEILVADPYDEEAAYQASRRLIHRGGPRATRQGASLIRYFQELKESSRTSTREEHLRAAGDAAGAALSRAARSERRGDLAAALEALREAIARDPRRFEAHLQAAGFWMRAGILEEARRALEEARESLPAERAPRRGRDGATSSTASNTAPRESARDALETLERERREMLDDLEGEEDGEVVRARRRLARTAWEEAAPALEALLAASAASGDTASADRAARLLLARAPRSRSALLYLALRTRDPALLIPHAHYLARLSRVDPDPRWKEELAEARRRFLGE